MRRRLLGGSPCVVLSGPGPLLELSQLNLVLHNVAVLFLHQVLQTHHPGLSFSLMLGFVCQMSMSDDVAETLDFR